MTDNQNAISPGDGPADAPSGGPGHGPDGEPDRLGGTTRFALEALDLAASLSDFSLSVASLDGPGPILALCGERVRGLLPFTAMGIMLVDEADSSFHLAWTDPPGDPSDLAAFAHEAIESGQFAFALREKRAVVVPAGPGRSGRLLHVLTTASRTRGMFVAEMGDASPALSEVTLSILSILMANTAQALESHFLHGHVRQVNAVLKDKLARLAQSELALTQARDNQERIIEEKTSALQGALDKLRGEVRSRKRAEALLAALNQRLEAKVEVRTRALFRKVAEMEEANERLRELERLKSGFLSSVSHELRTPLTSIRGFVKLVAKDFRRFFEPLAGDQLEPKATRMVRNLRIMEKESERLTRLINDVLDLSRIESGKMVWRDEPMDMAQVIVDAVMAVEVRLENRPGVRLLLDMPRKLPRPVGDRDRILQVLINLMDNALKFTSKGRVLVEAGLSEEGMLMVCVEDTGPGIAPEEAEKVFDKFHQHGHKDTLKDKPQGTGLGLAICRHIISRHGGSIWVEPGRGQGCAFCFTLPLAQEPGA